MEKEDININKTIDKLFREIIEIRIIKDQKMKKNLRDEIIKIIIRKIIKNNRKNKNCFQVMKILHQLKKN